uniref:Cystatin domain-containing protein n=1 Tax=Strongyloides venezuelensis TaxID=75913 RepID=A0A0K0FYN0_STRVS
MNFIFLAAFTLSTTFIVMTSQTMTGGWTDQPVNDTSIVELAQKTVNRFNQQSNDIAYHGFIKVLSAKSQVVAGMNYELQVLIGETDATKNHVLYDDLKKANVQVKNGGRQQIVTATIWSKPWENFEEITIKGVKQA